MKTYDKGDELPAEYRQALLHLLTFQADSEYAGAQRVGENLQFAPRPEEAYRLAKKTMEEYGHAFYLWTLVEDLGVDVKSRMEELRDNPENPDPKKVNIINGFRRSYWQDQFQCWEDVAMMSCVATPGAVIFLGQYAKCSYLPWARVSERIAREEVGHMGFGVWAVKRIIEFGGEDARAKLQRRVPKFIAMGMGMYGRPSEPGSVQSKYFDKYYEMGLKIMKPEECQAQYLELVQQRLKDVGLEYVEGVVPDYDQRIGYAMDDAELEMRVAGAA
ncbi:Phenylacetic acid catabolic protein [Phenylobacterium sp. J367]|uniref:Phenylacetic acid catabolic protein n=1 Tax=Phenylobacterium sp. J367 TaxID=2898435 RepID=UPI0021517064|nr:Phenylacetic acid catabolic protein [Phenylobacterium sp. J367]MCR5879629.1 phenylacetate-CoA oxygenase subunit PaaI [Phenylobacterium sp. J367]